MGLLSTLSGGLVGGSGSAPSATDVSGNIRTANALSSTATDQANQAFNTAKGYNANAQSTLGKVTGAQLPVMNKLADTTNANLSQYGSTFMPLQNKQAEDALAYGSDANIQRRQGMAVADVGSAAEAARKRSADALASEGVDPASIHGGALDRQAQLEASKAQAGAGTQSALQTEDTARQMVSGANQLGLQVGALGNQNASTGAGVGSSVVGDTNQTNQTGISNLTADSGLLNTGVNANSSAGNIAHQGNEDALAAYKAQQEGASGGAGLLGGVLGGLTGGGGGGMLGTLATGAMSFLDKGGAVGSGIPVPGSVNGIDHGVSMAKGGTVSHEGALPFAPMPAHPTDTKPALLTPGEYVIPKDVALHKGHEFFHKMVDKARLEMKDRQAIPHAPAVGV